MVTPITESNKNQWIQWCEQQLDYLNNSPDYLNPNTNRVFGSDSNDDIDEARNIIGSLYETLRNFTILPK